MRQAAGQATAAREEAILIKKYANRRLYNTAISRYVTLQKLRRMVKDGQDFVVRDAKSGEDITHTVLTQIILDEENRGNHVLPTGFLKQLIRFYGDGLGSALAPYLEISMNTFCRNERMVREAVNARGGPGETSLHEMSYETIADFRRAVGRSERAEPENPAEAGSAHQGGQIESLKEQLDAMQQQIDALLTRKGDNK